MAHTPKAQMRRRTFLKGLGAAAGLAAAGPAWGRAWGTAPETAAGLLYPAGVRAEKCLEVFLYGGLSPWEGFYVNPLHGRPTDSTFANQQWHTWANRHNNIFGNRCGLSDPSDWLLPWATAADGAEIALGPMTMPFRNRPDILDRLRVVVTRHDLEPHEAAIPYALSGMRLGNPRLVGMGAHVQRYFQEQADAPRPQPYSYVFQPNDILGTDNTRAADAVGAHPGSARPLSFRVGGDGTALLSQLQRSQLGDKRQAYDDLLAHYAGRTRARYQAESTDLRAKTLDDHRFAIDTLRQSDALREVLGDDLLAQVGGESCAWSQGENKTAMSLEAAVHLLTHPLAPARYVNVVDTGLQLADGGGGFDTHFEHLETQTANSQNVLQQLADRINAPGEGDPSKLDLDETMILITTEFGRTPRPQDGGQGTNHFPYGYVNIILGGPIDRGASGVRGAIGPDGVATDFVTPAEFRAAALAAMGMYPFAHESFAVGDIRTGATEAEQLQWLMSDVLGRGV